MSANNHTSDATSFAQQSCAQACATGCTDTTISPSHELLFTRSTGGPFTLLHNNSPLACTPGVGSLSQDAQAFVQSSPNVATSMTPMPAQHAVPLMKKPLTCSRAQTQGQPPRPQLSTLSLSRITFGIVTHTLMSSHQFTNCLCKFVPVRPSTPTSTWWLFAQLCAHRLQLVEPGNTLANLEAKFSELESTWAQVP